MKSSKTVIDTLNQLLTYELTSVNQYWTHGEILEDWGLKRLAERIVHESDDERLHAKMLIQRILFLEGKPDLQSIGPLNIGKDVHAMLKNDLKLEMKGRDALQKAIVLMEKQKDFQTRELLESILKDSEEDHIFWLEQQIGLIDKLGIDLYLTEQLK